MRKIWKFLKDHIREDFNFKQYLCIAVLVATALTVNYTFDFEDDYLDSLKGFNKFLNYCLFYAVPYVLAVFIYAKFNHKLILFRSTDFWIRILFGLTILSLDSSIPFLQPLIEKNVPVEMRLWTFKVSINMISFFTVFIPIILFYYFYEKRDHDVYGLKPTHFDVRPYFVMLAIMVPVMIVASHSESFLRQYPMYRISQAHEYMGVAEWVTVAAYEAAYGLDFITVEFLFRGFFVIAMINVLGRGSVLTMAVLYCTLHFGKPMGEAISSIFGGYILGVVAYETRSIWGGVIVHIGIAWTMELIAYIQKSF